MTIVDSLLFGAALHASGCSSLTTEQRFALSAFWRWMTCGAAVPPCPVR